MPAVHHINENSAHNAGGSEHKEIIALHVHQLAVLVALNQASLSDMIEHRCKIHVRDAGVRCTYHCTHICPDFGKCLSDGLAPFPIL